MGRIGRIGAALVVMVLCSGAASAASAPEKALDSWYRLMLELVRHTPTYTPPVASRSFAYVGRRHLPPAPAAGL